MYRTSYVQCTRTRAACGQKACGLTTHAILDTFKFRVFSFILVVNMDTSTTSRRSLKPSEDKEDRLRRRREREKARRAAETAEERQERLAKRRETGLDAQPRLTIRGGNGEGSTCGRDR